MPLDCVAIATALQEQCNDLQRERDRLVRDGQPGDITIRDRIVIVGTRVIIVGTRVVVVGPRVIVISPRVVISHGVVVPSRVIITGGKSERAPVCQHRAMTEKREQREERYSKDVWTAGHERVEMVAESGRGGKANPVVNPEHPVRL